ncbi:GtrA family protein [Mesobacillus boroniphilus]|uniref:GtrA family protein n=1 Tax=Mesobacillus boroniphilus TaxID=308892 RepID=UPI0012EB3D0D
MNKNYTFRDKRMVSSSIIKFFGVTFICYFVSYWLGIYLSEELLKFLHYKDGVSVLIGSGFYTITNYLGQKFYVFNSEQKRSYTI